jgi:glycerol-3-phosphate dehydrogenase
MAIELSVEQRAEMISKMQHMQHLYEQGHKLENERAHKHVHSHSYETEFDLVVIGGGITGAGVARDAASRGMSVALVEANDFAVGTSSRSSKLIHGGIRYLENLEFGLVFEALSERRLLFEIAPHLVHPLRFVLPLYSGGRVGMFKMGLGMWLYDALSMFEAPELHERLNPSETTERIGLLRAEGLLGSYVYSDAYMDDDRLVIETLRSAVKQGALAVNYVKADSAEIIDGQVRAIGVTDQLTQKKFKIRGRHFVSSVGPWTDTVATNLLKTWKPVLRPSKGVHLTFARDRLPLDQAVVMAADKEKRIVFGIPRHEMVIIGTTDTDYSGDPSDVSTTAEDVNYLLGVAKEYFPGAKLTSLDIIASYAGVRPLIDDGAETESKTSREHLIVRDSRNITFVAGGKYTTYRRMAEQTVEAALESKSYTLNDQIRFARNATKVPLNNLATVEKLNEASLFVDEWARESGLAKQDVELLINRHGWEAFHLLNSKLIGTTSQEKLWGAEANHAIKSTMCMHLVDFYMRRAPLFLSRPDHGLGMLEHLSHVFANSSELGWSETERRQEVALVQAMVKHELLWQNALDQRLK